MLIELSESALRAAAGFAAVVGERDCVLLLLAAFAFEVWLSTLWVALVDPPMHADHAQEFPMLRMVL
jgi:hypothetical protein